MPTLQQQIAEKFLEKLQVSKDFDTEQVEQLRKLLLAGKKVKAEELINIFSQPVGGGLK